MKHRMIFLLLALCACHGRAQTDEARRAYEEFKRQAGQEYQDFRKQANDQYAEFLKKAWTEYQILPAMPRPKHETTPPVVVPDEDRGKPIKDKPVPIDDVVPPPAPNPQPLPIGPIREDVSPKHTVVVCHYCGTEVKIRMNEASRFSLEGFDNRKIAEVWSMLSTEGMMNNTLRDCLLARMEMGLCDWAYLNLLHEFAKSVYGEGNEATLLTSYIYCQSGYKMRLAEMSGKLLLLYASRHDIFDTLCIQIDGTKFFLFNCQEEGRVYLADTAFPQEQPLSLFVPQEQQFAFSASASRTLKSQHYPDMEVRVQVNKNLIDFYQSYPSSVADNDFMTRWAMYANTPLDDHVKAVLYPALQNGIKGLGQLEAANKLIDWVQTAFDYEYDEKVWGHDRAFFAEESLYYPYCDCEDRAILFSRLVRDLLGLDVVLVYYPGHLATAIRFTEDVKGDYVVINSSRFVISDPTYIGASVGMTMKGMDNASSTVILLQQNTGH